jgi:hypothetical protein
MSAYASAGVCWWMEERVEMTRGSGLGKPDPPVSRDRWVHYFL